MTYRFTPAAQQELRGAAEWYLQDGGPRPAALFVSAVERAVRLLDATPRLGAPAYATLRTWPVRGFPYTLVYRADADGISVIAVAHQSREPGYWRGRA